jgi:cytochrome c553
MKRITSILALIALVTVVVRVASADERVASVGEAVARRDCMWCHGSNAGGFATAPRLAGQQADYIEHSLASFNRHARDNPRSKEFMWTASARLSPDMARAVAVYLSELEDGPAADGRSGPSERGAVIYKDGIPEANVPACLACHGPGAQGIGVIPRLAGLSSRYLKERLVQWTQGYHAEAEPMPNIAGKLTDDQIEVLASYLSYLN